MDDIGVSILRCERNSKDEAESRKLTASQIFDRATGFVFAGTAGGFTKVYGAPRKTAYDEKTGQGAVRADPECDKDCWHLFTFH